MFVFMHIPKTAGTLLGFVFDMGSGRKILWDYDPEYRNALRIDPLWIKNMEFIRAYFWSIHGHFFFRKYADVIPDANFITCVRDPIERTISQFKHEVFNAAVGWGSWRTEALLDGSMDVVDFAKSDENVRCAQCVHLEGRAIVDYDHVFVQERLSPSLQAFSARFGFTRSDGYGADLPQINDGARRRFRDQSHRRLYESLTCVTEAQRSALLTTLPEETELYRQAVEHWGNAHK